MAAAFSMFASRRLYLLLLVGIVVFAATAPSYAECFKDESGAEICCDANGNCQKQ